MRVSKREFSVMCTVGIPTTFVEAYNFPQIDLLTPKKKQGVLF